MIARLWSTLCRYVLMAACLIVVAAAATFAQHYPFLALFAGGWLLWLRMRRGFWSTSHGSARVASSADIRRAGLFASDGLIIGRSLPDAPSRMKAVFSLFSPWVPAAEACRGFLAAFVSPAWNAGRLLRLKDSVHCATIAPTGAGKSVSVLLPNLLSYPGACVVTDPKGELFRATAEHRKTRFGHKIIRLDPFGICTPDRSPGDSLNPCDFIDETQDQFLDDCRQLANMLVVRTGTEKEPHWNDSAELNICAFLTWVCGCEPERAKRSLSTVRAIASSRSSYAKAVEIMQKTDAAQGVIKRLGGLLTWFTGEEQSSVLTTFQRHTAFLDSPAIKRHIETSSFDPRILRTGKATIYLCLPPDMLQSLAALQRMWVGTIMRRITRGVTDEKTPVVWFLDEVANLGNLPIIEEAATLMRGSGIRLWFFWQSLDQVKKCFGENATTVLDNISTFQYFGINSYATAEEISKRIGDQTIRNTSINDTTSDSRPTGGPSKDGQSSSSRTTGTSVTSSDLGRRLLKPEEVLVLPDDIELVFHKNRPVIVAKTVKHYADPEFRRGRCGRQKALGLAAGVAATLVLATSLLFAYVTVSLPQALVVRLPAASASRPRYPSAYTSPYRSPYTPRYGNRSPRPRPLIWEGGTVYPIR